jgi:hypothetical protein
MNEFKYVQKAFQEEPTIEEQSTCKVWGDEVHQEYIKESISTRPYITENTVKLQFLGWELVLLKDGTYYINDTAGG